MVSLFVQVLQFFSNINPESFAFLQVLICRLVKNAEYGVHHGHSHLSHLFCDYYRRFSAPSIRPKSDPYFTFRICRNKRFIQEFFHRRQHFVVKSRRANCNCFRFIKFFGFYIIKTNSFYIHVHWFDPVSYCFGHSFCIPWGTEIDYYCFQPLSPSMQSNFSAIHGLKVSENKRSNLPGPKANK